MELLEKFEQTKKQLEEADKSLSELSQEISRLQKDYRKRLREASRMGQLTQIEDKELTSFFEEPYTIIPKKEDEWYIIVPKFIRMQVGWLEKTTKSYNIFTVNKFINWLAEVPQELQDKFRFKPKLPLKVYDGMLLTGDYQDEAWNRYKPHLNRREGKDKIRVKRGHEFKLIASMINDGILPFIPKPVEKKDLRKPEINFVLGEDNREFQLKARDKFLECGAIGVFWAYSAGKTFLGMHECAELKGDKLVIVPTNTLKEQWDERLKKYTNCRDEVQIETYAAFHKIRDREYVLTIWDEAHHLPANTYAKLATIKTKYRIGLSGSPYREDGRTNFIFALTGFPMGLDWNDLIKLGIIEEPDIRLYLLGTYHDKLKKLGELLREPKKTIIFCDSIDLGKRISSKFELPFVYGASSKRIETIEASETTVVSRVGDEGLSIGDIERVIEFNFLYGSRRQEGQRIGRLFHGKEKGEHVILMTEKEFEQYEKRLFSIYERGFKIEIVREV